MPAVGKACIISNGSLTFYTLPELSPAFNNGKLENCSWVGGLDENADMETTEHQDGIIIMICMKTRIRLIRIGEEARKFRDIQFAGCLKAVRRDNFACVADAHSYALLDVVQQQKVPLFPISSVDEQASAAVGGATEDLSVTGSQRPTRSSSLVGVLPRTIGSDRNKAAHERSTSLGTFGSRQEHQQQSAVGQSTSPRKSLEPPDPFTRPGSSQSDALSPERALSPSPKVAALDKPLPSTPAEQDTSRPPREVEQLKPHITSPTPSEFLLTTGTSSSDPGAGMFVNLDGDVVRGTITFSIYPESILVDGQGVDPTASLKPGEAPEEGFVLAVVGSSMENGSQKTIEIQRWDLDPSEGGGSKEVMFLPSLEKSSHLHVGVGKTIAKSEVHLAYIRDKLRLQQVNLNLPTQGQQQVGSDDPTTQNQEALAREKEEAMFTNRLTSTKCQIITWSGNNIWWTIRNSITVRLDARLDNARLAQSASAENGMRNAVEMVLNDIRGREFHTELEFLGLNYIRQKASLLLFTDLLARTASGIIVFERDKRVVEESLIMGEIDPRLVVALLPKLRDEVQQAAPGIWIPGGLKQLLESFMQSYDVSDIRLDVQGPYGDNLLSLVKRFLIHWRRKKGFGSIPDEKHVFATVDAALLHTLLLLDSISPRGPATAGSVRIELNSLVDSGLDCFDRGIELLEQFNRLYVLSRLYQNRKNPSKVLATWKRILDGAQDDGGELVDGDQTVRKYLASIRDAKLIEDYGTWLANRNPSLGVMVFADDNSKVKFEPAQAIDILKQRAPVAVKYFLEHLVFGKNVSSSIAKCQWPTQKLKSASFHNMPTISSRITSKLW